MLSDVYLKKFMEDSYIFDNVDLQMSLYLCIKILNLIVNILCTPGPWGRM